MAGAPARAGTADGPAARSPRRTTTPPSLSSGPPPSRPPWRRSTAVKPFLGPPLGKMEGPAGWPAVGCAGRVRCLCRAIYDGAGPMRPGTRYVGMDVHKDSIAVAVVEADGAELRRPRWGAYRRSPHGVGNVLRRAGRPQSSADVERVHQIILEECYRRTFAWTLVTHALPPCGRTWPPSSTRRSTPRSQRARRTQGRTPAQVLGAARMWTQRPSR